METSNTGSVDSGAKTSDRVCQFFLRGRCSRENCEFKHDSAKIQQKPSESGDSVDAEQPAQPPPVVAVKSTAPPPTIDDTLSNTVEESIRETSTFIAATLDEQPSTPLLVRRARPAKNGDNAKTARKDANGFERPEDYFGKDSVEGQSVEDQSVENQSVEDQSVEDQSVETPNVLDEKSLEEEVQAPVRDSVSAEEAETPQPKDTFSSEVTAPSESVPEQLMDEDKRAKGDKVADLSKEWDDEETNGKKTEDQSETIESIESFIQDESTASKTTTNQEASKEDKVGTKSKEEWVQAIFGEDGKPIPKTPTGKKSVYDLNPEGEDFSVSESTPFTAVQPKVEEPEVAKKGTKAVIAKQDGVTKIGNNTYFYSGPKSKAQQELELEEDEEEEEENEHAEEASEVPESQEDEESMIQEDLEPMEGEEDVKPAPKRRSQGKGYAEGRRKHSTQYVYGARSTAAKTRRCGECEGCNREDCGKCSACIDKPKFGGKGAKKQACLYRMCAWKNPSGKRIVPGSAPIAAPPIIPPTPPKGRKGAKAEVTPKTEGKRGRKSISVISPAAVKPADGELPAFDPETFKPGFKPPVVKKGDAEYAIIVAGVKDTGLCGKYWSDIDNLPPRRRRTTLEAAKDEEAKIKAATPGSAETEKKRPGRKQALKEKVEMIEDDKNAGEEMAVDNSDDKVEDFPKEDDTPKKGNVRKRKNDDNEDASKPTAKKPMTKVETPDEEQAELIKMPSKMEATNNQENLTKTSSGEMVAANRSVSCVAADSTQREVVVECFAPYDDHRWVNIGKERDGMAPDAVQYARALRPPYHLLSFLRIKGHSTKGMSCTDKNTMVFVVLEGEITVVLHTTQFNAKKGDSFYIPPKNYYNLINHKAREAELSLIQFQYDGPLPTVAAASQSGLQKQGN